MRSILKICLIAVTGLFFISGNAAISKPTEVEFTKIMLAKYNKQYPTKGIKAKENLVLLRTVDDDEELQINLHRIYDFCQQASTADCEIAANEYVAKTLSELPVRNSKDLRIIVRGGGYFTAINEHMQKMGKEEGRVVYKQVGSDLFALLAFDSTDTIAIGTKGDLNDNDISENEAWDLAEKQTRQILPAVPTAKQLEATVAIHNLDGYLASMMALTDDWQKLADELDSALYATITSDHSVFIFKDRDGLDLKGLAEVTKEDCLQQQRCISPYVYQFKDGQWSIVE